MTRDCKSLAFGLRRFESYFQHHLEMKKKTRSTTIIITITTICLAVFFLFCPIPLGKNNQDSTQHVITIKLMGEKEVNLCQSQSYEDPGIEVYQDGVKIENPKITTKTAYSKHKTGNYVVTYRYTDTTNKEYSASRKLNVSSECNVLFDELKAYIKSQPYDISFGYYNFEEDYQYTYHPDKVYYGASLVKTIDALYVYEKLDANSLKEEVKKAISVSDNDAHQAIVNSIGLNNLRNYGRNTIGMQNFLTTATNTCYGNTTINDQLAAWKYLNNFIKTNKKGAELESYFINDYYNDLIFSEDVTMLHKYGWLGSYFHNVGIAKTNSPYIIAVLTNGNNVTAQREIIKKLSEMTYEINKLL